MPDTAGGLPGSLQPWVLAGLILVALGFFAVALWPRWQVLRRAAPENRWEGLPQRFANTLKIAFGQAKMFKDPGPGWMHAVIFWGFLILLLRAAWFFWIGLFPGGTFPVPAPLLNLYSLIKDGVVLLVTLACIYGLYRRLILKPKRLNLSAEGVLILVLILLIMASDMLFDAARAARLPEEASLWSPLGWALARAGLETLKPANLTLLQAGAWWTHVLCILFFLNLLPRSKHFHIITSIPNVFFGNRTGRGNQLHRLDFEDESRETFGVTRIEEFSWKQLLDLYTCTECGRCDVFCPALNTEKPLSPKQFTLDLRDHLYARTPSLLAADETPAADPALMGGALQDETVWSCTTCGACEEECPVMIEYVNKMVDLRRGLVMMDDRYPKELADAFRSLETHGNPWGFPGHTRGDGVKQLGVKRWDKNNPSEYLYFVGCNGSFDNRGKKVTAAVVQALQTAGVDFAVLAEREGCTGDPARRLGNEYLFDMLAQANAETLKEEKVVKVIVHCPHCFNSFQNEYAEYGLRLEVIHHSQLLDRLVREGRLHPKAASAAAEPGAVVVHDSCYMGRHNKEYDAPRRVLDAAAGRDARREVPTSRERGTCCGAGGGRFLLEETTGTRISHMRVDELMRTEPDTIAVSCPFCVLMLEDALKAKGLADKVKVRDVAELL